MLDRLLNTITFGLLGKAPEADRDKKAVGSRVPVRENLESLAVAVALALILKFFLIEAYQIPTPSMQPALMGDSERGVYDRILVDKLSFHLREPRRFEVTVFKYPLHQAQNYIKRIWGLPGESLRVRGGDVWLGKPGVKLHPVLFFPAQATVIRKPLDLQEHLWLTVFDSRTTPGAVKAALRPVRGGVRLERKPDGHLLKVDGDGGAVRYAQIIRDALAHGYTDSAAEQVMDSLVRRAQVRTPGSGDKNLSPPVDSVPDLRVELLARPVQGGGDLTLELREDARRHEARIPIGQKGRARILVNDKEVAGAEVAGLAYGESTRVAFMNFDDQLYLLLDGEVVAHHTYESEGEVPADNRFRVGTSAKGSVLLEAIKVDRDIHYTDMRKSVIKVRGTQWIHMGPRHYLMLGDNTRKSEDGRAWQAVYLKDPATGRLIRGNCRPQEEWNEDPLNGDWNPVFVRSTRTIVFSDYLGEEHLLKPDLKGTGKVWEEQALNWFWGHKLETVSGVPREFLVGKALAVFFPVTPFRLRFIN